MKPHFKPSFRKLGKASGSAIGKIAVRIYVCRGCGLEHKLDKPAQCKSCGRMDFDHFDSTGEAGRWATLCLKVRAGLISDLQKQVRFPLMAYRADGAAVKVGEYHADFVYMRDGERVIEDFKGAITDLASWKLRHMAAQGLPVSIITAKGKHS